jgi:hypothetical protein
MIFGGGFVCEAGVEIGMQDPGPETQEQWEHTLDGADIDGERLFSTQPTQPTTEPVLTRDDAGKKKGKSHRTSGFNDVEDKCLWDAWLATNNDCINGARQKGKVCWAKVVQEYKEREHHKPYKMRSERMKESIQKT